jgi:thiol:disulfide interchange protein DsbA
MFNRLYGLALAACLSFSVHAAAPVEGVDYKVLKATQPTTTGKKVEVAEFFWYKCPHCFQLEPSLNSWKQKLPKDAELRRVPAVFNDTWLPGAKIFYALKQMKLVDKLHTEVFDAYHLDNLDLNDPKVLADWVAKQGVDRKKFMDIYNSFSVQTQASMGARVAAPYELRGVPAFVIDGKYATSQSMTGSEQKLFETLDALIVKARAERARKR